MISCSRPPESVSLYTELRVPSLEQANKHTQWHSGYIIQRLHIPRHVSAKWPRGVSNMQRTRWPRKVKRLVGQKKWGGGYTLGAFQSFFFFQGGGG